MNPSLDGMPVELLTMILARVLYDRGQGRSLRGVCKKFKSVINDQILPRKIAEAQYRSIHIIENVLNPIYQLEWSDLDSLYDIAQKYAPWYNHLPNVKADVLAVAIALIHASYSIRRSICSNTQGASQRLWCRYSLLLAVLVRKILPIEALILIRYTSHLTQRALQINEFQNSATGVGVPAEPFRKSKLCLAILSEARLLTTSRPPNTFLFDPKEVGTTYNSELLHTAQVMDKNLEDTFTDGFGIRSAFVLQLAAEQVLTKHFLANDLSFRPALDADSNELGAHDLELTNTVPNWKKLNRALRAHSLINSKIRAIFDDEQRVRDILATIDEKAIAKAMVTHFRAVDRLEDDELVYARDDNIKALGLDHWFEPANVGS